VVRKVASEVALLNDYESRWAIDWQKHTSKYDQFAILKSYYHALHRRAQSIDIVSPYAPLEGYKLVVAPIFTSFPRISLSVSKRMSKRVAIWSSDHVRD